MKDLQMQDPNGLGNASAEVLVALPLTRPLFPRLPKSMSGLTTSLLLVSQGLSCASWDQSVSAVTCQGQTDGQQFLALQGIDVHYTSMPH